MNVPNSNLPRVVVIGAGFGGIALATKLKNQNVQLVLIDKHNYHNFQPLMYQVATGGLEAGSIAYPIRKVMHNYKNGYFRMANITEIDDQRKTILSDIGELRYDYLVIATGSKTNFFGNKEMQRNSMGMKTISQALNIRSLILENFEQAVVKNDVCEQKCLMNFCLVGGGATGVELAGALAEMKKEILQKDYPDLDISRMQINLIQSGDRILNTMSEKASANATRFLTDLGVNVLTNLRVESYDGKNLLTNTNLSIETATVIWTAGVEGAMVNGLNSDAVSVRSSRINVNEFNQVHGYNAIFAIGDIAVMPSEEFPIGHPMMAQPALQQGKHLGDNLRRLLIGKKMLPFEYKDKGSMAVIGRNKAVVDLPKVHFSGFFAWFVWIFVHLFSLIGFKNKVIVFTNWLYNYINYDREDRLIIRPFKKKNFTSFTTDEI